MYLPNVRKRVTSRRTRFKATFAQLGNRSLFDFHIRWLRDKLTSSGYLSRTDHSTLNILLQLRLHNIFLPRPVKRKQSRTCWSNYACNYCSIRCESRPHSLTLAKISRKRSRWFVCIYFFYFLLYAICESTGEGGRRLLIWAVDVIKRFKVPGQCYHITRCTNFGR